MWMLRPEHQENMHPALLDGWAAVSQLRHRPGPGRPYARLSQQELPTSSWICSARQTRGTVLLPDHPHDERKGQLAVCASEGQAGTVVQARTLTRRSDSAGQRAWTLNFSGRRDPSGGGLARLPAAASHSSDQTTKSWDPAHQR
uniref:Uncharacterized protein n=1 Tax=Molossus molossus TaxID=27622 RepID=A0A7J8FZ44_MOLMO|nr:hypothetical protein HJG59_008271 [Molossus molossus]